MTTRIDQAPVMRTIAARARKTLEAEIARAKAHLCLPADASVCSCYEAGRDGFWLHRYLVSRSIANRIVDSSSIEVNRRRRLARKLVIAFRRYLDPGVLPEGAVLRA